MYNLLYITRMRRGLTQQELAERAGVSRRTICALEQTGRIPTAAVGKKLCYALNCGLEEVFHCDVLLR